MVTKHARLKPVSAENAPVIGVAITITKGGNTHAGIVYRDEKDKPRLLHLEFHKSLKNDPIGPDYLCADPELEIEDAEVVGGYCRQIATDNPPIWFAIHYNPHAKFAKFKEKMAFTGDDKGLNCSTFVLTIFSSAGPRLIDTSNWPKRPEDKAWHEKLVKFLESTDASPAHIKRVKKDIGCARIRPEEVAGACLEEVPPYAKFQACELNGQYVVAEIVKHTGRGKK